MTQKNSELTKPDEGAAEAPPPRFRDREDGTLELSTPASEMEAAVKRTIGVSSGSLANRLMSELMSVLANGRAVSAADANDAAALRHEIGPRDAVKGMLAVQMVAAHSAALRCLRHATHPDQSLEVREIYYKQSDKFMRTYTAQVEALNKHRKKARQTVVVKHVHVHEGGQAIVGSVDRREG